MTTVIRMDKDWSHMTERIINLTLEIIYLLTGEDYIVVKKISGDPLSPNRCLQGASPITEPPPLLTTQVTRAKKVLEVTRRITELLMEEVPIRCQDVSVYLSMEEWEYLEEHKDLYKDLIMEDHQPLPSLDGSRDPPQRCPRPLDSAQDPQEIPQEGQEASPHHQSNIIIKEELMEADLTQEPSEGHEDIMNGSSYCRNPPQRCLRPLNSQDSIQEPSTTPSHHQGEDVMEVKVKDEDDEAFVGEDQRYMEGEEPGMRRTFIQEDTPTQTNSVHVRERRRTSEEHLMWPPAWKGEDEDITWSGPGEGRPPPTSEGPPTERVGNLLQFSPEEDFFIYQVPHGEDIPSPSTYPEEPPISSDGAVPPSPGSYLHERSQGLRSYSCPVCGKSFVRKSHVDRHQRSHTGEKPYSCPDCGKCFSQKCHLTKHQKCHTGEKPYSCPECGQCYAQKSLLDRHHRFHTGEKPYSCPECGKCFTQQAHLSRHQRSHTGEKPYSCPDCGQCYSQKLQLVAHQIYHTGEKPYSCSECEKSFVRKQDLARHHRSHTGEKPYSCPVCGKCFSQKSHLPGHLRSHTGEKPYSCPQCGKCFVYKVDLTIHHRSHTGEKPYLCPQCGKCFSKKADLSRHLRAHVALHVD